MPVGKSAIKRVSSAGYANLKNEAPDMENSVVAVEEKRSAPVQNKTAAKPAAKKTETKPAVKKPAVKTAEAKPAAKKPTARKSVTKKPVKAEKKEEVKAAVLPRGAETAVKITESFRANEPESKGYYNLGDSMPVYLL